MSEMGDYWRDVKDHFRRKKNKALGNATRTHEEAEQLAAANNLSLSGGGYHYQLRRDGALWNLYPSTQRVYVDPAHKKATPFLKLPTPWTLMDVVLAALDALDGPMKERPNVSG